jgi:ribose transport system ATP-binding protein
VPSHDRPTAAPAFRLDGVSKSYPGVHALQDVTLEGYPGEVLAICGANGAGKSTMARLLAGQETPTDGSIHIGTHDGIRKPSDAEAAGVLLMHQEPLVIEDFTVEENVWLKSLSSADGVKPWGAVPRDRAARTREALDAVGLADVDPRTPVKDLGPGPRQMLALSRTSVNHHNVLLLDETTASTTEEHFRDVLDLVDRERADGVCVVFVSHRMPEVFAMADRIAVLRNGRLVDVVRTADTDPDQILTMMIGEAVSALEPFDMQADPAAEPILEVRGLSSGSAHDIDLDVRPCEIVGIYGLVGSGRSSIARSISGHQDRRSGTVRVHGSPVPSGSPRGALEKGVAYLSEDRRREGFVPAFTNALNLTLATPGLDSRWGVISPRREKSRVAALLTRYQVKGGAETMTRSLSGGNQQKVCIAKWLEARPEVMVLDEPTKGIDVRARLNIYEIIRDLATGGKGVVVVTSEAEEALKLCSRVLVLRDGAVVGSFDPLTSTTDDLIRASLGGDIS